MRVIMNRTRLGWWQSWTAGVLSKRNIFSVTEKWESEFNGKSRVEIEQQWKERLKKRDDKKRQEKSNREKYYVLSMFPYPSGKLHMGHVRVYAISDTMARYAALCGKQVVHPMGWDAFGLPAENAAIERGELPHVWTQSNIASMRKQMEDLGLSFDWERGFATCDPSYYKWTQYLFLKMYEAGLVYQKEAPVNWDPVDMTVLANEQIDEEGKSWRSGATVERKFLRQWYIRTEAYAKSLYDGLDDVDPEMWRDVILLQRHWIGKPDGTRVEFKVEAPDGTALDPVCVFSREAGCLYGLSHILLSAEHPLNNPKYHAEAGGDDAYIRLTIQAQHPLTGETVPVYIAPSGVLEEDSESKLAIPSYSEEDTRVAEQLGLSYKHVLDADGRLVNSQQLDGMSPSEAFTEVTKELKAHGSGGHMMSEKCGDWLISRQRYWGTPIPMMHCQKYGTQPIPYEDLPVELPEITEFRGKGHSPLASAEEWRKVKCAKCDCGGYGLRETDTMDTFVDSSWYFLRYLSPGNDSAPFDPSDASKLMPVDLYIGGKEHAVLHLYFARFFMHFLYDAGLVPCREPFHKLLTQGMVMGRSYRTDAGKYLPLDMVQQTTGGKFVHRETGEMVVTDWEKMSKSKYNGVDPEEVVAKYGAEATRLCILANVAPKSDRKWDEEVFQGVHRWQARMWSLITEHIKQKEDGRHDNQPPADALSKAEEDIFEIRNMIVKDVSFCLGSTFLLNTAIAHLQKLTSELKKVSSSLTAVHRTDQFEHALADLLVMTAPFAPHFVCELWAGLGSVAGKCKQYDWESTVLDQQWPTVDPSYRLSLKVKKDGKFSVYQVKLPFSPDEATSLSKLEALNLAVSHPSFVEHFGQIDSIKDDDVQLQFMPKMRATLVIHTKKKKKKKAKQQKEAKAG